MPPNDKTPKKHVCKVITMHMAPFLWKKNLLTF